MNSRGRFLLATGLSGVGGLALWIFPADPDAQFTGLRLLGTVLLFLYSALCLFGWGQGLVRVFRLEGVLFPLLPIFAATLWGAFAMALLGHAGLIGPGEDWLALGLLSLGPVIGQMPLSRSAPAAASAPGLSPALSKRAWLTLAALALPVALRLLIASAAHGTSDPFLYHLLGPRIWWQEGRVALPAQMPIVYQGTYWEYFLLWGNALFAGENGRGLIEFHLFGQWAHALFGFGGTTVALYALFRALGAARGVAVLATLAGISSEELWNYAWLAKNDWVAAFWTLTALAVGLEPAVRERLGEHRKAQLVAFIGGAAIATKWNMAPTLAGVWFWRVVIGPNRPDFLKTSLRALPALLLPMLPIWVRNVWETGNPIFPFMMDFFGSDLMGWGFRHGPTARFMPERWFGALRQLAGTNLLCLGIVLLPALRRRFIATWPSIAALALTVGAGYVGFAFLKIPEDLLRWLGPPLLLAGALGVFPAAAWVERTRARAVIPLAIIGLLGLHVLRDQRFLLTPIVGPTPNQVIRSDGIHVGGSAKAWLRLNAGAGDLTISTGDNQLYYVAHRPVLTLVNSPWLDRLTAPDEYRSGEDLLEVLDALNARFLLDSCHWSGPYWSHLGERLGLLLERHPEAILHQGRCTRVADLRRLREEIHGACLAPPNSQKMLTFFR